MPICTGSDGGGSIRIPSSYSGLFGFKTSFGRVGYAGNFDSALTSVPGPMCRSVRDAARYIDAIAGPTNNDPTSLPRPARSYEDAVVSGDAAAQLRGKRAAWSSTLGFAVCDPEVEKLAYEAALALCADAGIELVDVDVGFRGPGGAWGLISIARHRGRPSRRGARIAGTTSRRSRARVCRRSTSINAEQLDAFGCGAASSCSPRSVTCSTRSTCCSRRRPRRPRSSPRDRRRWRSAGRRSAAWARCRTPRRSTSRACPG